MGLTTLLFLLVFDVKGDCLGRAPIEMKAHNPVNYVDDMLAFCFQSCSVEADVAKGLVVVEYNADIGVGGDEGTATSAEPVLFHV